MQSLSIKQIDAQLKRTNWRISDIAKRYGTDSATYRKATAFLFNDTESKDINGNVTITRQVKSEYSNITHFVTTKEGNTYIAIDRTKSAKERFKKALENPNSDNLAKLYNQARNVKTQGQLERQLLGSRNEEIKDLPAGERHQLAEEEIERVSQLTENFNQELNDIYDKFTDKEIKDMLPDMYKSGKRSYSELADLLEIMKQNTNSTSQNTRLPLGG